MARSNPTAPWRVMVSSSPCRRAVTAPDVTVSSTGAPPDSASAATMLAITMGAIVPPLAVARQSGAHPGLCGDGSPGVALDRLRRAPVDDQLERVGHVPLQR